MCGFLQRSTAADNVKWDAPVSAATMRRLRETADMIVKRGDPVRGKWLVEPDAPMNVWVDASSVAVGVALEVDGQIIEDAAWLRPQGDSAHINRSELDAAIRGINLALLWGRRPMTLITDSATVYGWLRAIIHHTHNIRTRALSEVLIRRRLDTLREVIDEEGLDVQIRLVPSAKNLADALTRVPKTWWQTREDAIVPAAFVAVSAERASVDGELSERHATTLHDVWKLHERCHFGVDRTLELAKERFGAGISRRMVRKVVSRCDRCARIDPTVSIRWDHGTLAAPNVWQRWATDITHVNGRPHLVVVDTASGFSMWRPLRCESAQEVCGHLGQLFSEFGPPESLLSDNGTVFRSRGASALLERWDVQQELACAYRPQGNGIVERVHRTVKRTAKRIDGTLQEAVFWLNNTRGQRAASPYELVFGARPRLPGVSAARVLIERPPLTAIAEATGPGRNAARNPFAVGDRVYLRRPDGRCDLEWSGPHRVTAVLSNVSVVLNDDGVSRHVSHLRRVPQLLTPNSCGDTSDDSSNDSDSSWGRHGGAGADAPVLPRRSTRKRQPPARLQDYVT